MRYRKVCPGCQKKFESDDRSLIEGRVCCDECFTALPDAVEEVGDVDAPPPASMVAAAPSVPPTPKAEVHEGPFDEFGLPVESIPMTRTSSAPIPPVGISVRDANSPAPAAANQEQPKDAAHPRAYELHWVGTNRSSRLPVILPDALDGGYVGRDASFCVADVNLPTVSRIQFAYRNADGCPGIEITNLGQFGTWVNGRLLRRNESAIAPPGSVIEMGGFEFELCEGT